MRRREVTQRVENKPESASMTNKLLNGVFICRFQTLSDYTEIIGFMAEFWAIPSPMLILGKLAATSLSNQPVNLSSLVSTKGTSPLIRKSLHCILKTRRYN